MKYLNVTIQTFVSDTECIFYQEYWCYIDYYSHVRYNFLQFITFGFACTPLYFVWEKFVGVHETKSLFKRALVRLPVVVPIWFLAIIFPFFGPINSTVGSLLVSFTVYIIPAMAHMVTFASASAREVIIVLMYYHRDSDTLSANSNIHLF